MHPGASDRYRNFFRVAHGRPKVCRIVRGFRKCALCVHFFPFFCGAGFFFTSEKSRTSAHGGRRSGAAPPTPPPASFLLLSGLRRKGTVLKGSSWRLVSDVILPLLMKKLLLSPLPPLSPPSPPPPPFLSPPSPPYPGSVRWGPQWFGII